MIFIKYLTALWKSPHKKTLAIPSQVITNDQSCRDSDPKEVSPMATKKKEINFTGREGKINFMGREMTRVIYLAKCKSRIAVPSSALWNLRKTSRAVIRSVS